MIFSARTGAGTLLPYLSLHEFPNMRKPCTVLALALLLSALTLEGAAQGEPFTMTVLNRKPANPDKYYLGHPFEILYGPDDFLYVTEKVGRVVRVDPLTGIHQVILDITNKVHFTVARNGSGAATSVGQDGMLGMALHPGFGQGTGHDSVYVAYTYNTGLLRISAFLYNGGATPSLTGETVLIQGLTANSDHSAGRIVFGNDGLLYYANGDGGGNQFSFRCNEIRSQKTPTAIEVAAGNHVNYAGKILRMNRDGSIPSDNPSFNGVQSHVYTLGHRNPQGLVTQKDPTNGLSFPTATAGGKLFSSEHGPRTDDEINVIEGGKNYGWPYIAGYLDKLNYQYIIWATSTACASTPYNENNIPAGAMIRQEDDTVLTNFQPPLSTLYTECSPLPLSTCDAGGTNWMKYPTIAPSSVDYYHVNAGTGIPDWYPSLLVPTLRRGVLFRYKLNATQDAFITDSIPYFRTTNRYRDIALSPDGKKIYLITDSTGTTSGPSGTGTSVLSNPGSILEFVYTGATLALVPGDSVANRQRDYHVSVYPNPASHYVVVDLSAAAFTRETVYMLYDMSGRILSEGRSRQRTFRLPLDGFGKGIYLLRLYDGNGLALKTTKVLVQ
jgi:PQQ-dependent dehydrogenase (s-GDH family)